eukprot:Gregarina_sp_Poly_1__851@NODE_1202_length_4790_cov_179_623121_g796_i1_p1_GENE_NODE_1202_length_4790_cov_179_623121_g796_i1NODE_1202_length_4790_cov_179_623121_g796_i1_p1_ORF_typecomplete_len426_score36_58DSPc/PF00782_20/3_1e30CDKN3/PF05706_12/0_00016Init_tRNA_PT/PF04179_12/0_031Y_phosphatase/PF00102_27/0_053PTPlike_phytase/PF14566_6/0_063Y_phosphatase2/PF03162_13/0_069_NODE_1202_length_4790_cov_179_623121_g796_i133104587
MTEITPGLFLGGLPSTATEFLTAHNIQAVVSCCNEYDFGEPPIPMSQFRVPVEDISNEPILDYMEDACQFIKKNLELGGVLIHCRSGVSRSATIVIGYLMKTMVRSRNLSLNDSFMLVISRRSCICPNIGFMRQLCILEELLLGSGDFEPSRYCSYSDNLTQRRNLPGPPPMTTAADDNPAVATSSTCGCCLSEPSSPSALSEKVHREVVDPPLILDQRRSTSPMPAATTTSMTALALDSPAATGLGSAPCNGQLQSSKDIERLRSLGQALMASQYSSAYSACGAGSDSSTPPPSRECESSPPEEGPIKSRVSSQLSFDQPSLPVTETHSALGTLRTPPPDVRVHSADALHSLGDRRFAQRVSVSSGPSSPAAHYHTPRNAMSCVHSPDNLIHSLAVKSPSLSMSKYISWYTMSGERATAPSLAP